MASEKRNVLGPHDDNMYLKKKGIVDLEQMYADIWKWFLNHGYELHETDAKTKTPSPMGSEEEIWLHGWRNEDDFTRWHIKLIITIWDSIPVEVMKNNKPVKMFKCRMRIKFDVHFELDYERKWDKSRIMVALRKFYIQTIIQRKMSTEGDKFEYEFHELHDLIKKSVGMEAHGDQYAHYWKN